MKCIIFSGADIFDYNFVASYIDEDDFIICADSGVRHAEKLGLVADVVIGDFDSVTDNGYKKHKEVARIDADDLCQRHAAFAGDFGEFIIGYIVGFDRDDRTGNTDDLVIYFKHYFTCFLTCSSRAASRFL